MNFESPQAPGAVVNGSIQLSGVGKAYRSYSGSMARLREWVRPSHPTHQLTWVLRNIDLGIAPGESVGLIGINGAGKSTLLKIITGTTQPTGGTVTVAGRMTAMLELGMGFHPEVSGRHNALMACQLMGIPAAQAASLLPAIIDFAEIGDYIDQPIRLYSTGMQMRVAFAVVTALRPDILIVDEAMAVGDAYFQHKSFDRIRQFQKAGTTLLLVSHDRQAIQSICKRAVLLSGGVVARDGDPESVFDFYNALIADHDGRQIVAQQQREDGRIATSSGTGEAALESIRLIDQSDRPVELIDVGARVTLEIAVRIKAAIPRFVVGYMIKDRTGQPMFGTNTDLRDRVLIDLVEGDRLTYRFRFDANLGPGTYSVATALCSSDTHLVNNYEWRDLALVFEVANMSRGQFIGSAWIEPEIEVIR